MKNAAKLVPEAMQAMMALDAAIKKSPLPPLIPLMVHLRASQINGCSYCVDMHARELKQAGETDQRIFAIAAWRDAPFFTEAERAALALTEAATRLADRPDPVPDDVWNEAAKHFDQPSLANLILNIALINFWNRTTVTIRQPAGAL